MEEDFLKEMDCSWTVQGKVWEGRCGASVGSENRGARTQGADEGSGLFPIAPAESQVTGEGGVLWQQVTKHRVLGQAQKTPEMVLHPIHRRAKGAPMVAGVGLPGKEGAVKDTFGVLQQESRTIWEPHCLEVVSGVQGVWGP